MYRLVLILLLFAATSARAGHIVGGEMFYDHLGGNTYRITVKLYRECSGIAFDDPIYIGIYSGTGTYLQTLTPSYPGSELVPVILDSPCLSAPPNVCVETTSYVAMVELPPSPDGYVLSYQRCCRTNLISNLPEPDELGLTVTTRIPGDPFAINSSPRFTELPPIVLCFNEPLAFDHSAVDPDGDELVYELCTPFNGGATFSAQPIPSTATAPPYSPLPWSSGYSATYPIDSDPAISIDANTGELTLTPTLLGFFVVGVCVSEYRDGQLLGSSRRDFLFNVVACDAAVVSVIAPQTQLCSGLNATFANNSIGAVEYAWDLGDPTTDQDVSTMSNPTWTYPTPGDYTVTLITNPGTVCADTATRVYQMYDDPMPFFTTPDTLCGPSQITLMAEGSFYPTASVSWDLGVGADPNSVQGAEATAIFGTSGMQQVTLTVTQGNCTEQVTAPVHVFPQPEAFFIPDPVSPQFIGTEVRFLDGSMIEGGSIVSWEWTINGLQHSTEPNTAWLSAVPGDHMVTLTVATAFGCMHDYAVIYRIMPADVEIPNVFTPNGDGQNEYFVIENAQYVKNTLTIYNRWGMPVHDVKDYKNNWRAIEVPDGTYYYVFTIQEGRTYTGHLTILR